MTRPFRGYRTLRAGLRNAAASSGASATMIDANIATLTDEGYALVKEAAPGHVARVRELIFDRLSPKQIGELEQIGDAIRSNLDPEKRMPTYVT